MAVGDNFRSGDVIQGGVAGLVSKTVTLTADGQTINPSALGTSMINLESDSTTATDRTFTLLAGQQDGQGLLLVFTSGSSTSADLQDTGSVVLSAAWQPTQNDALQLRYNARLAKWVEVSRADN